MNYVFGISSVVWREMFFQHTWNSDSFFSKTWRKWIETLCSSLKACGSFTNAPCGIQPPPGVGYLPSGGWICHLKLAGCKPLKMADSLFCLCESAAKRQMVAETACGIVTVHTAATLHEQTHTHAHTEPQGAAQWVWPSRMTALPCRPSCERWPDGGWKEVKNQSFLWLFVLQCLQRCTTRWSFAERGRY